MTTTRMSAFPYHVGNPAAIERALAPPIIQKVDDEKALLVALIERARRKPKTGGARQHLRVHEPTYTRHPDSVIRNPPVCPSRGTSAPLPLGPQHAPHRRPNRHPDRTIPRQRDLACHYVHYLVIKCLRVTDSAKSGVVANSRALIQIHPSL